MCGHQKEMVIGKKERIIDLKQKIAQLYKNENVQVENIVIAKGWSTVTMTAQSASRLEWFHSTILKTLPENHDMGDEEILFLQREAIAGQNDDTIGTPSGFHLRSGDVLVWQDMYVSPSEKTKKKLKSEEEERHAQRSQRHGNSRHVFGKSFEPELKILTHEEWQEKEEQKKLEEKNKHYNLLKFKRIFPLQKGKLTKI
ncbi:hypothetical protein RFI_24062 [Reticulomyxa filosa]|uniref:Uncharacterized protein n=1 Tax=Reticulomyxa filosa TaxID=46433 RepID=X6MJS4_RETFI|nr:hypothetical protein RFI_24062 [Reticulomyxa filosa]|eukprot:ETO13315.1 hypothetical protein RFI_24062 [Reticulomyxa filosa]